jgi:hypothetical protein
MNNCLLIINAVFIFVLLTTGLFLFIRRKSDNPPDYYSLFIVGLLWIAAGTPTKLYALSIIGAVLTIIGLRHRKEWKKNWQSSYYLNRSQKIWLISVIIFLTVVIFAGFIVILLNNSEV